MYYKEDGSLDKTIVYKKGWQAKTTYANGKIEISRAPENNLKVFTSGEEPDKLNKPGTEIMELTKDKDGRTIMIHHKPNGDSTIIIMRLGGLEKEEK